MCVKHSGSLIGVVAHVLTGETGPAEGDNL